LDKEVLHAYGYGKEHGGKGGNSVALLLMKHVDDRGLFGGTKRRSLNVVMDNWSQGLPHTRRKRILQKSSFCILDQRP
jgi:hypothetical protein